MKAILKINYGGLTKGKVLQKWGTYYKTECGNHQIHENNVEREADIFELVTTDGTTENTSNKKTYLYPNND